MAAVRRVLAQADLTAFVLVLIPERLPIEETVRARQALEESGMSLAGLVVNRVLPAEAGGEYLAARRGQEQVYLAEIARRLSGPPRVEVPLFSSDVSGVDALGQVARFMLAQ
jgi:arsenite-transporting ATPase